MFFDLLLFWRSATLLRTRENRENGDSLSVLYVRSSFIASVLLKAMNLPSFPKATDRLFKLLLRDWEKLSWFSCWLIQNPKACLLSPGSGDAEMYKINFLLAAYKSWETQSNYPEDSLRCAEIKQLWEPREGPTKAAWQNRKEHLLVS